MFYEVREPRGKALQRLDKRVRECTTGKPLGTYRVPVIGLLCQSEDQEM